MFNDTIEAYITGQLSQAETSAMEKAMQTDEVLVQEVALRRTEFDASEAVIADDIRAQFASLRNNGNAPEHVQQAAETPPSKIRRPWLVVALSISIGLLGIAVLWRFFSIKPPMTTEPQTTPSVRDTIALPEKQPIVPTGSPKPPVANTIEKSKTSTPRPPAPAAPQSNGLGGGLVQKTGF